MTGPQMSGSQVTGPQEEAQVAPGYFEGGTRISGESQEGCEGE
jgi:hypothetical protein